jgi:hypothetical protein
MEICSKGVCPLCCVPDSTFFKNCDTKRQNLRFSQPCCWWLQFSVMLHSVFGKFFPLLWRIVVTSSPWSYSRIVPLFGLLDPEDEGTTILQNVGNQYPLICHIISEDMNILFLNVMLCTRWWTESRSLVMQSRRNSSGNIIVDWLGNINC